MIGKLGALMRGDGLKARATRGSLLTIGQFGIANFLRLASNLILTRILFPEAFGLMALVMVVIAALEMFSVTGIGPSIIQNKRGEDPAFLNTAWSVQIIRGFVLWAFAILLAGPAATFYDQPLLAQMIPVAGFAAVIAGFQSTNIFTADRNLTLGKLTVVEILSQFLSIAAMILAAWYTQSAWSLLLAPLGAALVKTVMSHVYLPGIRNRFSWESEAFWAIFHYGKYIFIGSIAGYLIKSGDRMILGKFVTLTELAVYNFGYFLATVPVMLSNAVGVKLFMPIYSRMAGTTDPNDIRQRTRARGIMVTGMLVLSIFFSLIGVWLVKLLYEAEYHLAGPIMVLIAIGYMPAMIIHSYGLRLLGEGSSRDMTIFSIVQALFQLLILLVGVQQLGLMGAIIAPPLAVACVYPLLAWQVHRYDGWEPKLDILFVAIIAAGLALTLWVNDTSVMQVLEGAADQSPAEVVR